MAKKCSKIWWSFDTARSAWNKSGRIRQPATWNYYYYYYWYYYCSYVYYYYYHYDYYLLPRLRLSLPSSLSSSFGRRVYSILHMYYMSKTVYSILQNNDRIYCILSLSLSLSVYIYIERESDTYTYTYIGLGRAGAPPSAPDGVGLGPTLLWIVLINNASSYHIILK